MPGPGISLAILSNNFSPLTAASFAAERLVLMGAVSELDERGLEVGAAIEVARSHSLSEVSVTIAARSARGGLGVRVLEGCCWTRLRFDCDPDLCFPNVLSFEENFEDMNLRMIRFELDKHTRLRF